MEDHARERLLGIADSAQKIAFFGGAGVSTESGIPDFRSADGLYSERLGTVSPEEILSHHFFEQEPSTFYSFYRAALIHPKAQPNAAHLALAALEADGRLSGVVTQNIDGLHQRAGGAPQLGHVAAQVHVLRCGVGKQRLEVVDFKLHLGD